MVEYAITAIGGSFASLVTNLERGISRLWLVMRNEMKHRGNEVTMPSRF
jgi:hypothetical protein